MLSRRGLIGGLLAAPAIIRTPGLLMPVKPVLETIMVPFFRGATCVWVPMSREHVMRAVQIMNAELAP